MKLVVILAAGLLLGGCGNLIVAPASPMVGVEVAEPIEYYLWGGQFHYWHDNHYEVVDHVPEGQYWVKVDRQPEHPLLRHENEQPGSHRIYNDRDEPVR